MGSIQNQNVIPLHPFKQTLIAEMVTEKKEIGIRHSVITFIKSKGINRTERCHYLSEATFGSLLQRGYITRYKNKGNPTYYNLFKKSL